MQTALIFLGGMVSGATALLAFAICKASAMEAAPMSPPTETALDFERPEWIKVTPIRRG